jgi:hypothetical protein
MIKALTENPELKFNCRSNEIYGGIDVGMIGGYLCDLESKSKLLLNLRVSPEWGLIQEPVDFMTAFNTWAKEGKTIIVELPIAPEFRFSSVKIKPTDDIFSSSFDASWIKFGKWFIED